MIQQGEVYLVDFAKKYSSEFGKVRPAVILQNNFLNRVLSISKFQSVLVVPLTTQDIQTEYKIKIDPRDNLKEKSFIVANWLCTLDIKRIQIDKGIIAKLNDDELTILKSKICVGSLLKLIFSFFCKTLFTQHAVGKFMFTY